MLLRQSNDGIYHLFFWDAQNARMNEIATGKIGEDRGACGFLVGDEETDFRLYRTAEDVIPVCTRGEIHSFFGHIVYQRAGQWYCFDNGQEVLLGIREEVSGWSFDERLAWKAYSSYFVLSVDGGGYILSFIRKGGLLQETCIQYEEYRGYIFARQNGSDFDVYYDGAPYVGTDKKPLRDAKGNFYFWSESRKCWRRQFNSPSFCIGPNAVVGRCGKDAVLYQIDADANVREIRRGKGGCKISAAAIAYQIGGWIYPINLRTERVEFDLARPTWWQKYFGRG